MPEGARKRCHPRIATLQPRSPSMMVVTAHHVADVFPGLPEKPFVRPPTAWQTVGSARSKDVLGFHIIGGVSVPGRGGVLLVFGDGGCMVIGRIQEATCLPRVSPPARPRRASAAAGPTGQTPICGDSIRQKRPVTAT